MVEPTIRLQKRIQFLHSAEAPTVLTVADFSAAVPGGTTYWNSIRIDRVDVWALDGGQAEVTVSPDSSWNQPPLHLLDIGTAGQRRGAVGFRLGLLDRARFFGVAAADAVCTVGGGSLVIQASIELISPA
jgi:hypothetical protein